MRWTPPVPLQPALRLSPRVLAETLDGGQAFRWRCEVVDGLDCWTGIWSGQIVRLQSDVEGNLTWSAPAPMAEQVARALPAYLAVETDFAALTDQLPWRGDLHLRAAIKTWSGLRVLRQPLEETLLAFLCSSVKQIVQIRVLCDTMGRRFGKQLLPGLHALPTWHTLHRTAEEDLRACGLGYRARYIKGTAAFLADNPLQLQGLDTLPLPEARDRLMRLPGVGLKIADCVLLFGAGRLEAFPMDTWIFKAMAKLYGLEGWKPEAIGKFANIHFAPAPGLAQQYLFAHMRAAGKVRTPR